MQKKKHNLESTFSIIDWEEDCLILPPQILKSLFNVVIAPIIAHVKSLHEKLPQISYIFLVGGFAESPMIQSAFIKNFPTVKVIIPPYPVKSILEGGVIFGMNPDIISIRKVRKTYGILISKKFEKGVHLEADKHTVDGEVFGKNFDVIIKQNVDVNAQDCILKIYRPVGKDQTQAILNFCEYEGVDAEECFLKDREQVKDLGQLIISSPDTSIGTERIFLTKILFGRTQLEVTAIDAYSGKTAHAKFDFISKKTK